MHDRHNNEAESSERERRARAAEPGERPSGVPGSAEHILHLQRTLGNAVVARAIADARSDGVEVQRSAVHDVLRSSGEPLDEPVRTDMESRLGADFSDVRLHTGPAAQRSAAEIGARAYTSGNHVVIGEGGTDKHTLAHELTHVIQQRSGPVAGTDNGDGLKVSDPSDRFEREAEQNAKRVMAQPYRNQVASEIDSPVAEDALQRAPASNPGPRSGLMTNEEWFGTTAQGEVDKEKRFQTHASLIYTDDSGQDENLLTATNVPGSADEEAMHAEDILIAGLRNNLDKFKPGPHRYHKVIFSVTKSPCTSESRDGLPSTSNKRRGCTEAILDLATNGIQDGDRVYKFKIVLVVRGLYHAKVQGGKKASDKALDALGAHPQIEVSKDLSQQEIDALNQDV
ncbi:DUF4157 domain-containing protein [Saccharopolyspora sp. 5N102]|uniref:DUF4157 domain-containing protein n=1 Tax=Saccharopolyspora sp. 5N102 TaxID=3375155 RepID=UPI0037ACA513